MLAEKLLNMKNIKKKIHHHDCCETHALLLVMSIGELGKLCSKSITIVIITIVIITIVIIIIVIVFLSKKSD